MFIFSWKEFKYLLKSILFFIVYFSGTLHLGILFSKKVKKRHVATILFYHRFCDGSNDPYHLPHLDIKDFKKQMCHIKRWYRVITMDELADKLTGRKYFVSPSIAITIDDGYLNNYTLAYPVLKALGLPAIIYLTTGLIGTNKAPWVDSLMDVLSQTKGKELRFPELLGDETVDISTPKGKRDAEIKLFKVMLKLEDKKRIRALEKLSKMLAVNETSKRNANRIMMNWGEVMEMVVNGISFGAHTVTHPILSKMELERSKQEIYESKIEIEERVGRKVRHFAVPNGKNEDFNDELKRYCKEIGMLTVASTESGVVSDQSDPYFLKRINPPPPIYIFACELARDMFLRRSK